MSTHQHTQGYVPGAWGSTLPPAAPAFEAFASPLSGNENRADVGAAAAASAPTTFASPPQLPPPQKRDSAAKAREDAFAAQRAEGARADAERAERERDPYPRLRMVVLPLATLPRFLAIASANTACNLETCGLLLGREFTRYIVETLLIPKQHATSDTCTMDDEEGVLGFTEERGLITIGWIHTHPSQSCFMSSVDLHTHASFQRMLPESFAVVCAPKSDPSFGIFRLTDPPGLQTVLQCTAKQAFHPHPNVPIYTDADKGHVQMRDAALEIVDLR
ncbi:Mov34-domain-containing protein [Mycena galericulata]|nr:Mov34-domain-containing protein [Mycena galericulata]